MRAVLDRNLRTPLEAKILAVEPERVIFYVGRWAAIEKRKQIERTGASVVTIDAEPEDELNFVMTDLCGRGANYLMCEAGAGLTSSLINAGLADAISLFLAPKLMGRGISFTDGVTIDGMDKCVALKDVKYSESGGDLLIEGVMECSPDL